LQLLPVPAVPNVPAQMDAAGTVLAAILRRIERLRGPSTAA
jgi:hypothetical protein